MEKEKSKDNKKTSTKKTAAKKAENVKKTEVEKKTRATKDDVKKSVVAKKTETTKDVVKKVEAPKEAEAVKEVAKKVEVPKKVKGAKEATKTTVSKVEKIEPKVKTVEKRTVSRKKRRESNFGGILALLFVVIISAFLGWLVANATESTYDVAFIIGNSTASNVKVQVNSNVLKPEDPKKEGYIFEGWYNGNVKFDFNTEITEDITLTAKWTKVEEIKKYTVTFNSNFGSAVQTQTIESGKLATEPTKPIRDGYTFEGWYNGDVKYNFALPVTSNITLTAKWTKIEENKTDDKTDNKTETVTKYTVKFNYGYSNKVTTKSVEKGKTVAKPSNPTRSGYTFLGWYYNGAKFDFSTKITKNITITAKWEKKDVISYKIEEIPSSTLKQVRLYLTLNGKAVAGTADVINTQGQTIHVTVPASGLIKFVKGTIKSVTNIKVK